MQKEVYLEKLLHGQGIDLTEAQLSKLLSFHTLLTEKNKVMNLTAITDFEEVCRKHFLDSLMIDHLPELLAPGTNLIDVGCGAGFPGLVLAIACPQISVTLMDSLKKRIGFLEECIEKLELANCRAVHARAEDLGRDEAYRESFDLAVSRAVANLSTLSEYCLPFVREGGAFVAYKAAKIKSEAPEAQTAIRLLGGKPEKEFAFFLGGGPAAGSEERNAVAGKIGAEEIGDEKIGEDYRNLYVIRKIKQTPKKYPRKAGLPAKEPLGQE